MYKLKKSKYVALVVRRHGSKQDMFINKLWH